MRVHDQLDAAARDAAAHPADGAASGRLGMILHAYQKLDLAEICYRRAHLLDPATFAWAYYLSVVEQNRGEIGEAIDDARAAVKLDPTSGPARMHLADALLAGHEFKESRGIYEKLVAEEPDLALYHYGLGKVLAAQGDSILDAIPQFRRACELSPSYSAARYALAMAYRQIKDLDQAAHEIAIYQKNPASAPPENPLMAQITALNLDRSPGAQGRPEEAAKQLEDAIASDPNDEVAHSTLVAIYRELKQWDKAEKHYRFAAKLNPSTNSHYVFGLVMLDQDRYSEAGDAFRRALALNPYDSAAHTQLGRVLEFQGDTKGAMEEYQSALTSDPNSRATNYVLGVALLKQGQTQDAIDHLLKTLQPVDEKTPGYLLQVAAAYRKAGDEEHAGAYTQLAGRGGPTASNAPAGLSTAVLAGQTDAPVQTAPPAPSHP